MPIPKLQKEADKIFRNWQLSQKDKLRYLSEQFPDKPIWDLEQALDKAEEDFLNSNTLYYQPPRN